MNAKQPRGVGQVGLAQLAGRLAWPRWSGGGGWGRKGDASPPLAAAPNFVLNTERPRPRPLPPLFGGPAPGEPSRVRKPAFAEASLGPLGHSARREEGGKGRGGPRRALQVSPGQRRSRKQKPDRPPRPAPLCALGHPHALLAAAGGRPRVGNLCYLLLDGPQPLAALPNRRIGHSCSPYEHTVSRRDHCPRRSFEPLRAGCPVACPVLNGLGRCEWNPSGVAVACLARAVIPGAGAVGPLAGRGGWGGVAPRVAPSMERLGQCVGGGPGQGSARFGPFRRLGVFVSPAAGHPPNRAIHAPPPPRDVCRLAGLAPPTPTPCCGGC